MSEDSEPKCDIKKIMILNRIEFFYEMREVLRGEKAPSSASGLVDIKYVFDFIFDLGLEDAALFAFDEDEKETTMLFEFDEDDDTEVSSLEDSDTE